MHTSELRWEDILLIICREQERYFSHDHKDILDFSAIFPCVLYIAADCRINKLGNACISERFLRITGVVDLVHRPG
jgi:hypothetical protein